MDDDGNGDSQRIGQFETSVHELISNPGENYNLHSSDKKHGTFKADCSIEKRPTFCQFIAGGCEISVIVGKRKRYRPPSAFPQNIKSVL